MRLEITAPNVRDLARQGKVLERAEFKAMHRSVDRATRLAQKGGQQKARAVGLGRLAGAIASTSSERKRRRDPKLAWGAIYPRGGADSRAGGALAAYTQGATIRGRNVEWLAIATRALPRRIGRYRTTPQRYEEAGSPLGPLVFRRLSANRAILIAQGDFSVSRKTGRAKGWKGRATRTRVKKRDVVAFVLIRETRRAKRFDQEAITRRASSKVSDYMAEELMEALPGQVQKG